MEERRGPEYVSASTYAASRTRSRRRFLWVIPPLLGVGLALVAFRLYTPRAVSDKRVAEMISLFQLHPNFHSIERRAVGDGQSILREDYVINGKRRSQRFDGDVIFISPGRGEFYAYEPDVNIVRKHETNDLTEAAPLRLLVAASDPTADFSTNASGNLTIGYRDRRYDVHFALSGLPDRWIIYYRTERGFEPLLNVSTEWDVNDERLVTANWPPKNAKTVTMRTLANPLTPEAKKGVAIGNLDLVEGNVNQYGDFIFAYRSVDYRPFFEVSTPNGDGVYGVVTLSQHVPFGDRGAYGEIVSLRMEGQVKWPLTLKLTVRNYDPRITTMSIKNEVVGTWTHTFSGPTCSIAPYYWLDTSLSDKRYFFFLRNRAYWRSEILESALHNKDGRLIDVLNGGTMGIGDPSELTQSPEDLEAAIEDTRMLIRYRSESVGGSMPIQAVYIRLAELQLAAGHTEDAKVTVRYLQDELRFEPAYAGMSNDVERLSRRLGL